MKKLFKYLFNRGVPNRAFLMMCALSASLSVFAQQGKRSVSGTVSDESGEPVAGANVVEKGVLSNGTMTNADGQFSLNVSQGATLVVSYIGYATKEEPVGSKTTLNIVLSENTQLLDEVVVVGYGTQRKADLAGNVATLNANDLRTIPTSSLSQAIGGRIAGVAVRSGSGGTPGNNADIVIGSRGTWNSTSPLYVIDGIVRDADAFNLLSPADIEHFSVLKDASAAAVYGARASNGVILVTTKRGETGKPAITYQGSYTLGEPAYEPRQSTFEEHYWAINAARMEMNSVKPAGQAITADGYQPMYTSIYVNGKDGSDGYISGAFSDEAYAYYSAHQYDRLQEVYNTPATATHSLNVSGGNESIKYFFAGNFNDETGMFKSTAFKKYNVRSNLEAAITKNLKATLSVNLSNSVRTSALNEDGSEMDDRMKEVYYRLRRSSMLIPGILDGKYITQEPTNTNGNATSYSALADGAAGVLDKDNTWQEYTAGLTWEIPWVKGLTAKVLYNRYSKTYYGHAKPKQYESYSLLRGNNSESEYAKNGGKDPSGVIVVPELGPHATRGSMVAWQESTLSKSYQANAQLSYTNTFGKNMVEAMLVYEQTESNSEYHGGKRPGLKIDALPWLDFGGDDRNTWSLWGGASEEGRISYVGRFGYTYDNRYQASFSFRNDLSSKFGPSIANKSGFFPAGNVYWRVSEESFVKDNLSWLNNFKLRASLGLTGNDAVSAYQYLNAAKISDNGMYWSGSAKPGAGVSISDIGNPAITWEKSLNRNFGIDLGVFNMFTASVDMWNKHTYDILGSQNNEVPDVFGAKIANVNYGIVDTWGIDIEVGFNKQINRDLSVWAKGNFGWADNKLVEFAETGIPENQSKLGKNYDRTILFKSDGIVWDLRPQLDASGNQVTKDYNDGRGAQKMYVLKTSKGNTYIVPQNYYLRDNGGKIDDGGYNNLRPGHVFKVDLTGDGHFDDQDPLERYWGIERFNPPMNFGLLLGGKWKGLSLEVFMQGSAGNQNYLKYTNTASRVWDGTNWGFWAADVFSVAYNPTGQYPIFVNGPSDANNGSDFWTRDASYVRLKNLTLSYDLPKSLLAKAKISGVNVYVSAQNLCFLYNAFEFFDPELTPKPNDDKVDYTNSPSNNSMWDSGVTNYPLMRTVSLGVMLSF